MDVTTEVTTATQTQTTVRVNWFAGLWRWHFYASVLVIPIFAMLAITGLMWLYRYEIQTLLHPGVVAGFQYTQAQPVDVQVLAVMKEFPEGQVLLVMEPWNDRATMVVVQNGDHQLQVFVNPGTAQVTGFLKADEEIYDKALQLHSNLMVGKWGDGLIELATCWAIFMAISGYFLYFSRPRAWNKSSSLARPDYVGKQNLRFSHGLLGVILGIGILFQSVSGLPWTGFWGENVQNLATGQGLSLWGEDPGAESKLGPHLEHGSGESAPAPWALGESELPESDHAGHDTHNQGVAELGLSVDYLITKAEAEGLPRPYLILMPEGETGVYSVLADQWMVKGNPAFSDVALEKVLHFDRYSGEILAQYGYDNYSPAAKLVSQAIAIHEGRRFGLFTTITATFFCLGILAMCITGPIMWWTRRRTGRGLDAPKGDLPLTNPWFLGLLVIMGIILPLFGLSLIILFVFDRFVVRRIPPLQKFFNA